MPIIQFLLDFFLHIDKNLAVLIQNFGIFSYLLLFFVIFMETGFVVTPFLPGDSLLFAAGALAAVGSFNLILLYLLMVLAAFLGDTVNYWIGHQIGPKVFSPNFKFRRLFKLEYLHKAEAFYDKHGGKAIILARFVPIVRTFAPFIAGVSNMKYTKFISYNFIGGLVWVTLFVFGGYFFGQLPLIKNNFHYSIVVIVLISIVPILLEVYKSKRHS